MKGSFCTTGPRKSENIIIEISDTGSGFDAEKQKSIFKIFGNFGKKWSKQINTGGAGIGLRLCKKISDILNIKIKCNSQKNIGSTFKLIIS